MNARTLFVTVVVSVAGATARLRPLAERSRMIVVTHVVEKCCSCESGSSKEEK